MKQGSGTFTAVSDVSQLNAVFQAIAGQIGAAVKDAAVTDLMGPGFEIPAANVSSIVTVPGIPAATYNSDTKTITWNPGTLTTPIEEGSNIKYAELKYRIEINDDILTQTPDENGEYPTNSDAQVSYKDADGNSQTGTFPVPMVNPVLYKVVKVLQDKDGNVITADRNFTVQVTGPGKDGNYTVRSFTLNASTQNSTKLMTDLRYSSTYTFEETGNLSAYDVTYYVNGNEVSGADRKFEIVNNNTADVEVKVVNKEKSVDISGAKTWDDANNQDGKRPASITINLYKKVGEAEKAFVESKTVKADANGNWTWSFTNQPKYEGDVEIVYSITEDVVTGYTTTVSGYNVTNTHVPETVDISGAKTWDDADNQDGIRPASIKINLY
ncbi:MAG: Cna B-type domain-containing protein, partial [Clostridiaceae bacterium]|nr:Cna B-type domain-containing protein [Clostridiaceae bacterium]